MPNILNNYKPQDPRVFPQSTISMLNVWMSDFICIQNPFECESEFTLLYFCSAVSIYKINIVKLY